MSRYASRVVVVTSLDLEAPSYAIGIERVHRKALEFGCKAVTPIVGDAETSNGVYSFLVGSSGNHLEHADCDVEQTAFLAWLWKNVDAGTSPVRFADVEFKDNNDEDGDVDSSCVITDPYNDAGLIAHVRLPRRP